MLSKNVLQVTDLKLTIIKVFVKQSFNSSATLAMLNLLMCVD